MLFIVGEWVVGNEDDKFDLKESWRGVQREGRWVCAEVFGEEVYRKQDAREMQENAGVGILKGMQMQKQNNVRVKGAMIDGMEVKCEEWG